MSNKNEFHWPMGFFISNKIEFHWPMGFNISNKIAFYWPMGFNISNKIELHWPMGFSVSHKLWLRWIVLNSSCWIFEVQFSKEKTREVAWVTVMSARPGRRPPPPGLPTHTAPWWVPPWVSPCSGHSSERRPLHQNKTTWTSLTNPGKTCGPTCWLIQVCCQCNDYTWLLSIFYYYLLLFVKFISRGKYVFALKSSDVVLSTL